MSIICIEEANIEHAKIIWELRNEKITIRPISLFNRDLLKFSNEEVLIEKQISYFFFRLLHRIMQLTNYQELAFCS